MKERVGKKSILVVLLTMLMPLMTLATDYVFYPEMEVGEQRDFSVPAVIISNINNYRVKSWSWSLGGGTDKSCLTIVSKNNRNCTVRAEKEGSILLLYEITFEGDDWYRPTWEATVSYIITIKNPRPVTDVTISPSAVDMKIGEEITLSATVSPSNAMDKTVEWSSTNTSVAKIISSNNTTATIKSVSAGSARIVCKAKNGSDKQGYCSVTVTAGPVSVSEIQLSETSLSLNPGEKKQLTATVLPSNATNKSITWTSSDKNIATVDNGQVNAISSGDAIITCMANDGSGVKSTCKVHVKTTLAIDENNFPDETFRNYLLAQDYGKDGKLTDDEISKITYIYVAGKYSEPGNLYSLKGIEHFTALTYLNCSYNQLESLDVSKCTALESLYCYYNQLTSLDLPINSALTSLACQYNKLTELDVSKLALLTRLECNNNQLTSLDVSKLTALTNLSCSYNQLSTLDVAKLTKLTDLSCYNDQLTTLDVSKLTALTYLACQDNQLSTLDVSKLTALTSLSCNGNQLTTLDVSELTELTSLYCYNNQLSTLDVSKLTALKRLHCSNNQLSILDVSNLTALTHLTCNDNQLSTLDVSKLTALTSLDCDNNQLSTLDVSNLTALTSLSCSYNQLTQLDVSNLTALTSLSCSYNQFTQLDVSNLTALTRLSCYNNQLSTLDVSNLTALTSLSCFHNQLTQLDVSNLMVLIYLSCDNNQLSTLDVSNLTALTSLSCSYNQLTQLDVSKNTKLSFISIYKNLIKDVAMDDLISGLPQNTSDNIYHFQVVSKDIANESNICTVAQVEAAKEKGWTPCYFDSSIMDYVDYEGSDATPSADGYYFTKTTMLENGKRYLIVANWENVLRVAQPVASDKTYSYLYVSSIAGGSETIRQDNLDNAFTIEAVIGGYTIRQNDGRYLYQKAQYNSFNVDTAPTEGNLWYLMSNADGTFRIQNASLGKYIQYSTTYGSYGGYPDEQGIMPYLYVQTTGTGIETINSSVSDDARIFNLSGQRLSAPKKGINIIRGKKLLMK